VSDLSAAAAALGVPEAIVQRSAAARATETGMTVDEVLAAWAGGEAAPAGAAPPAESESETDPAPVSSPSDPPAEQEEVESTSVEDEAPAPEAAPAPRAAAVTRSPVPAQVTSAEAALLDEVVTVPTAGIRERMNLSVPAWLAAVFLIIPAFALLTLGGSATGACGEGTELSTDVITGQIVNCDGSEFTGSGTGVGGADFIAQGEALYNAVPGNCQGCHGATGQGSGAIPGLTGVLTTFGACEDHIEWVTLGSTGFRAAGRTTYGDTSKPINDGMPAFGGSLSEEQIASVAAFERVRFGGADPEQILAECGLTSEEDAGPEEGAPGDEEAPAEGEDATSTTESGAEAGVAGTG
jgi:mono/diheme cytochrome c family protein